MGFWRTPRQTLGVLDALHQASDEWRGVGMQWEQLQRRRSPRASSRSWAPQTPIHVRASEDMR